MKSMLFDLSAKPELQPLADVVRPLQAQAARLDAQLFLMGAAARDVMLLHAYGIDTKRKTEDMDFGVMVSDWATFETLRESLIASGEFKAVSNDATHKLWHRSGRPLDIVPFGGVERADRKLAWPPDEHTVFDCFGMREAMASGHEVRLPGGTSIRVASVSALALLKITAWQDRKLTHPGRDAGDLMLYLGHYLDCDIYDHAARHYPDVFDAPDFEHEVAGARILGRDLRQLLDEAATERVLAILQPEADEQGQRLLAQQSRVETSRAVRMIAGLCEGLRHTE
jgi:predicted nucleotidyltransferase